MKRFLLLAGAVLLVGLGAAWAMQNAQENSDKSKEAAGDYKISTEDAARVNPVKSSAEGLAEARKVFGYDCDMCHGPKGDGKGDVVESMKLTMHDWHDPATLANMRGGDRVPEKLRWNLVNLVRAMAAKGEPKSAAAASNP